MIVKHNPVNGETPASESYVFADWTGEALLYLDEIFCVYPGTIPGPDSKNKW